MEEASTPSGTLLATEPEISSPANTSADAVIGPDIRIGLPIIRRRRRPLARYRHHFRYLSPTDAGREIHTDLTNHPPRHRFPLPTTERRTAAGMRAGVPVDIS